VAALALLALLPESRRRWTWRTLLVGSAYAATMILFVAGNKLTTAANTIFLQSTAPLYLLLLGPFLLHEPIRRSDVLVMLALAAGLALLLAGTQPSVASAPDPATGNLLALLSGVSFALGLTGLRWLARTDDVGPALVASNVLAFLFCLPMALPVTASRPSDWLVIAGLGCVQVGLAYRLLAAGVRHVPALEVSLLLLLEPVLNPIWAWMVHGEAPGHLSLAGGAVVLAATTSRALLTRLTASPAQG
jgi:drug/metabolite transporter (DMT)-like permease